MASLRRRLKGSVALVPTMGALHEGHLSLVRQARASARHVLVSLFVNPLQFGPGEDFARYPRAFARDRRLLAREGADILFAPSPRELYPEGYASRVRVDGLLTRVYEGALRPGHFEGVATVVLKLFNLARPDMAVFGRKDLQQVAVIRRLVRDLDLGIAILEGETVRESSGLALSSRNAYLSPEERVRAALFSAALRSGRDLARRGGSRVRVLAAVRKFLARPGAPRLAYLGLVDPLTFQELSRPRPGTALVASARIGPVRLLDNLRV